MISYEEMQTRLFAAENKLAEVTRQRNTSWEEAKKIRLAINANHEESTLDEVVRVVAQRDELLSALEFAREKIAELHIEAGDGDCHYPLIDDAIGRAKGGAA